MLTRDPGPPRGAQKHDDNTLTRGVYRVPYTDGVGARSVLVAVSENCARIAEVAVPDDVALWRAFNAVEAMLDALSPLRTPALTVTTPSTSERRRARRAVRPSLAIVR